MKITIIVPVYKVEKYLIKCVESIRNQTYKNLEIILVDDGSPDKCGEICDNFAENDNRVVAIHKENGGLSSARNAALEVATGDYCMFVDSDDYIDSITVEKVVDYIKKYKADIVQFGYYNEYENGQIKNKAMFESYAYHSNEEILHAFFKVGPIDHVVWNKIYKSSMLSSIKMVEGRWHEDTMATFDILLQAQSMITVPECFYHYLQRKDSISNATFTDKNLDSIFAAEYIIDKARKSKPEYVKDAAFILALNCTYLYQKVHKSGLSKQEKEKYQKIIKNNFFVAWRIMDGLNGIRGKRIKSSILVFTFRWFRALLLVK